MSQEEPEPQWIKDLRKDIKDLIPLLKPPGPTDTQKDAEALDRLIKHTETCQDEDCIIAKKLTTLHSKPERETKKCEECEKETLKTAKYCPDCGTEFEEAAEE